MFNETELGIAYAVHQVVEKEAARHGISEHRVAVIIAMAACTRAMDTGSTIEELSADFTRLMVAALQAADADKPAPEGVAKH